MNFYLFVLHSGSVLFFYLKTHNLLYTNRQTTPTTNMNNNTDTQLYDYTGWIATSVPASMNTDEDLQTSKLAQLVSSSPSLSTNTSTETDTQSNTNLMPTGTSTNVGKVFPWELCPYELRDQIFDALDKCHWQPYFGWDSDGCPPPFLVAVRSLPLSYEHALQRFAQCSSQIHMHLWTSHDLTDMVQAELNVIEKVDLELRSVVFTIPERAIIGKLTLSVQ
jgi:hypothetical protein